MHSPFARLALAAFLPLPLAGCGRPESGAVMTALTRLGFERIVLAATPWWRGPCRWDEPFTVRVTASRDGRRTTAVLCAQDETAEGARLIGLRDVRVPAWDQFGAAR